MYVNEKPEKEKPQIDVVGQKPKRILFQSIYERPRWEYYRDRVVLAEVVRGRSFIRLVRRITGEYLEFPDKIVSFADLQRCDFSSYGFTQEEWNRIKDYLATVYKRFEKEGLPACDQQSAQDE